MEDFYSFENNQLMFIPPFEHEEPEVDDRGVPEQPIYSNYTKFIWTSHPRTGVEIDLTAQTSIIAVKQEAKPSA